MSKPDEITQDAWDAGLKEARFYADWLHAGNSSGSVSPHAVTALADTISRAIMAAEAKAYANAADLAQRMGAGRKAQSEQAKAAKQPKVARDFESMAMSAFDVADAICKRWGC